MSNIAQAIHQNSERLLPAFARTPGVRRTSTFAVFVAIVLLMTGGCRSTPVPSRDTALPATGGSAASSSNPAPASMSAQASASAGTPAPLPTEWRPCTNTTRGYAIDYPANWYTVSPDSDLACHWFNPSAFTIPTSGSSVFETALNAGQTGDSFTAYVAHLTTNDSFKNVLFHEETTISGRRAVRIETSSTGAGMYAAGTKRYFYAIDRDGRAFLAWAMAPPGDTRYQTWKAVVDRAVTTVRFL